MRINTITARSIPDTRGRPTVEATLKAQQGSTLNPNSQGRTLLHATASVPSGKSTGSHEAKELRDADGGVATAIAHVEGEIAALLTSHEWGSPDEIDAAMIALDGTPNKSRLGANAILAVSIAAERLFAQAAGVPLWRAIAKRAGGRKRSFESVPSATTSPQAFRPAGFERNALETSLPVASNPPRLFLNFINGGVHADFRLPFQEYILVVEGPTSEALPVAREAFAKLGERLKSGTPMGDEGGYAPTFDALEKPFELLADLVDEFPRTSIAIDAAASELYKGGAYHLLGKMYAPDDLAALYEKLVARFPFHSIEDPFFEDASADFAHLTRALRDKVIIIGDDFTVTNPARIEAARRANAITGVLVKPNQIGSVKEAIEAVRMTHDAGWAAVCSHRSGETGDTFIADFAYGVGAHGIKAGGLGQKERLEKYERLLAIEREAVSG